MEARATSLMLLADVGDRKRQTKVSTMIALDSPAPNSSASTVPEAFVCFSLASGRVPLDPVSVIPEVDETTEMGAESDNEPLRQVEG